jgi:tetratricopeptide (TPR) repeat protein
MASEVVEIIEELLELKEFDFARKASEQALLKFPESIELKRLLAITEGLRGNHQRAMELYKEIFEVTKSEYDLLNLITSTAATGQKEKAIEIMEFAHPFFGPESVEVLAQNLGVAI